MAAKRMRRWVPPGVETALHCRRAWLLPDLDARLADGRRRAVLIAAIATLEAEPALIGSAWPSQAWAPGALSANADRSGSET